MAKGKLKFLGSVNKFSLFLVARPFPCLTKGKKFLSSNNKSLLRADGNKKSLLNGRNSRDGGRKTKIFIIQKIFWNLFFVCVCCLTIAPGLPLSVHMLLIFQNRDRLG